MLVIPESKWTRFISECFPQPKFNALEVISENFMTSLKEPIEIMKRFNYVVRRIRKKTAKPIAKFTE